jgi:hypothetical protein
MIENLTISELKVFIAVEDFKGSYWKYSALPELLCVKLEGPMWSINEHTAQKEYTRLITEEIKMVYIDYRRAYDLYTVCRFATALWMLTKRRGTDASTVFQQHHEKDNEVLLSWGMHLFKTVDSEEELIRAVLNGESLEGF